MLGKNFDAKKYKYQSSCKFGLGFIFCAEDTSYLDPGG